MHVATFPLEISIDASQCIHEGRFEVGQDRLIHKTMIGGCLTDGILRALHDQIDGAALLTIVLDGAAECLFVVMEIFAGERGLVDGFEVAHQFQLSLVEVGAWV